MKCDYVIKVTTSKERVYECRSKYDVFLFLNMIDANEYHHFGENWLRHGSVEITGKINRFFYFRKDLLDFATKMVKEYYSK